MYEKHPTYACAECHKSFKNQRALKAHNAAVHGPVQKAKDRLDQRVDTSEPSRRGNTVPDGDGNYLTVIDEASDIDPKWFDKL